MGLSFRLLGNYYENLNKEKNPFHGGIHKRVRSVRHLHISMVAFDVCIFRHEIYIALSQAANHVSSGEGFRVSK